MYLIRSEFLNFSTIAIWAGLCDGLCCGEPPCVFVGCLRTSLALFIKCQQNSFSLPPTPPSPGQDNRKCLSTLPNILWKESYPLGEPLCSMIGVVCTVFSNNLKIYMNVSNSMWKANLWKSIQTKALLGTQGRLPSLHIKVTLSSLNLDKIRLNGFLL